MRSLIVLAAVVVVLVLGHARAASADAVAYTCTGAPNIKPITDGGACIGFVAFDDTKREVQRVDKGYKMSGVILATGDGSTVAMLQTFPLASPGPKFEAMDALVFFRGGKVIAKYTMADLVQRPKLVTATVSHVIWIADMPEAKRLGKTLELTTSSMRKYSFEVATGKQVTAEDTDAWKACDLIAYLGDTPPAPKGDIYTLPRVKFAKGAAPTPFVVRAGAGVRVASGTTLCVKALAGGSWTATKDLGVMFNDL